jgi:hypothetical protein
MQFNSQTAVDILFEVILLLAAVRLPAHIKLLIEHLWGDFGFFSWRNFIQWSLLQIVTLEMISPWPYKILVFLIYWCTSIPKAFSVAIITDILILYSLGYIYTLACLGKGTEIKQSLVIRCFCSSLGSGIIVLLFCPYWVGEGVEWWVGCWVIVAGIVVSGVYDLKGRIGLMEREEACVSKRGQNEDHFVSHYLWKLWDGIHYKNADRPNDSIPR